MTPYQLCIRKRAKQKACWKQHLTQLHSKQLGFLHPPLRGKWGLASQAFLLLCLVLKFRSEVRKGLEQITGVAVRGFNPRRRISC
eukprot:1844297-Rhodomonas_salina.2